jgi:hypothetical protein
MRAASVLLLLVVALWAIDVFALRGRYTGGFNQVIEAQAQQVNGQIKRWLSASRP